MSASRFVRARSPARSRTVRSTSTKRGPETQAAGALLDRDVTRDVAWRPIATLRSAPRNARNHSDQHIRQIATSIREFGFTNPVLIDERGMILAGHGRVASRTAGVVLVGAAAAASETHHREGVGWRAALDDDEHYVDAIPL